MINKNIVFSNSQKVQNRVPYTNKIDKDGILLNKICVFPFSIVSGYVNQTEKGFIKDTSLSATSFFEKVFTGCEAIKVVWDNSTILTAATKNKNHFKYNFQVGNFYLGEVIPGSSQQGIEISEVKENDDFLAMKQNQTIKLRFEFKSSTIFDNNVDILAHEWFLKDEDKFKLYLIPEICENKLLYISNSEYLIDATGGIIGQEVEFSTIVDLLQNSGRAIEQYIQFGAPAEPYAYPTITHTKNSKGQSRKNVVLADNRKQLNELVKYAQIELQGSGVFSGCILAGRKLYKDDENNEICSEMWRWIEPYTFYQPTLNNLNHTSAPSSVYAFCDNVEFKLWTSTDFMDLYKKFCDAIAAPSCSGRFRWDDKTYYEGSNPQTGYHLSNKDKLAYWDVNWYPNSHKDSSKYVSHDMEGCYYTSDSMIVGKKDTFLTTWWKMSFFILNFPILPVNYEFSKPYRVSNIPLVGSFLTPMIGDRIIVRNTTGRKNGSVYGFIDTNYLMTLANCTTIENDVNLLIDSLGGEKVPKGFGADKYNETFFYSLTDTFIQNGKSHNTIELGQTTYENGTYIYDNKTPFNLNVGVVSDTPQFTPQPCDYGFVIDKVIINGFFNGKIKITFFDRFFNPVYTTTVLSETAYLEGSYKDWQTIINLGSWPDEYIRDYAPIWPQQPTKSNNMDLGITTITDDHTHYHNHFISMLGAINENKVEVYGSYLADSDNVFTAINNGFGNSPYWRKDDYEKCSPFEDRPDEKDKRLVFRKQIYPARQFIFSYGTLSDRDTFISKISELKLDMLGSWYKHSASDDLYNTYQRIENISQEKDYTTTPSITLIPGTYEYSKSFILGMKRDINTDMGYDVRHMKDSDFGSQGLAAYKRYYHWSYGTFKYDAKTLYLTNFDQRKDEDFTVDSYIWFKISITFGDTSTGIVVDVSPIYNYIGDTSYGLGDSTNIPKYTPQDGSLENIFACWSISQACMEAGNYFETHLQAYLSLNGINFVERKSDTLIEYIPDEIGEVSVNNESIAIETTKTVDIKKIKLIRTKVV